MERAPYDSRYVITTYEDKHNHEVPPLRIRKKNRSRGSGDGGDNDAPSLNDFTRFNIVESFPNNDKNMMNFGGSSSIAPMKYPNSLNNGNYAMPYYGLYGLTHESFVAP